MVDIRVQKNKSSVESISNLNSIVDVEKGEIIRIIQAEQSITIIIDDKNLDKFHNIFNNYLLMSLFCQYQELLRYSMHLTIPKHKTFFHFPIWKGRNVRTMLDFLTQQKHGYRLYVRLNLVQPNVALD